MNRLRGLYAVTPDTHDDDWLAEAVAAAVAGGARAVQYRNKTADDAQRLRQARRLVEICAKGNVPLIVNDAPPVAHDVGAAGVHLGRDDGPIDEARAVLGLEAIVGVSCYDDFARAELLAQQADYVAFGSLFGSQVKPGAVRAPLELLARARARGWNVVGIGGVDASNAAQAMAAGADALAAPMRDWLYPRGAGSELLVQLVSRGAAAMIVSILESPVEPDLASR